MLRGFYILIAGFVIFIQAYPVNATDYVVEQWRMVELVFTSTNNYNNPFLDIDMSATFTNGGTTITRPAFWDGGNTWKIRFAPTQTGTWYYNTNCSDTSNNGLHNQTGTVLADTYSGSLSLYKHGFLKVSDDHHYFNYADGTPFFYLGDTHWMVMHERWNICNFADCTSQFQYEVDKRVSQGFTVYQTEWMQPHSDFSASDEEAFYSGMSDCDIKNEDLPGFQNADRKMGYLADKGLVIAAAVEWRGLAPNCSDDYLRRYGQYWAARYGAYPLLWTTAQEVDGLYDGDPLNLNTKWQVVGQSLKDNDGYGHPLTAHMCYQINASDSSWKNLNYHDWFAAQKSSLGESTTADFYYSGKPTVLYEPYYENFWTDQFGERVSAYSAFLSGWYGFGYGVAGIWDDTFRCSPTRDSGTAYDPNCKEWYNGLFRESGNDMKRFRDFYTSMEWWKLTPRFRDSSRLSATHPNETQIASDSYNVYVAYFYNTDTNTGTLKNMNTGANYTAKWFNPRTGEYTTIASFVPSSGDWSIPNKPDSNDWLLLAEADHNEVNLALNRTYNSSSNWDGTQTAAKAFDNGFSSNWQAGNGTAAGQGFNNSWLEIDFGVNTTFNKVRLSEYGGRTQGYRIEYWDGSSWQLAYAGTTLAVNPNFKDITFPSVTGSKVRILFTSGTAFSPIIYEFEVYNAPPLADFSGTPLTGKIPLFAYLSDLSVNPTSAWSWSFGDGGTDNEQNPMHTYTLPGYYNVSLTSTNAAGSNTKIKTNYITVLPCLNAPTKKLSGATASYYSDFQSAYTWAADNDSLFSQAFVFNGDILFDRDIQISLTGGYDCDYLINPGKTVIHGSMTFSNGTVTLGNVTIQ